jgi:hypothetical protein
VRAISEGWVDDLNIISEAECVFCVVRHNSEERFDHLNTKYEAELLSAK